MYLSWANQRPLSVTPEVCPLATEIDGIGGRHASAALHLKLGLASPVHTRDAMGKRDGKAAKAKRAERRGKGSLKTEAKTAIAEGKQDRKKAFAKDEEDLDAPRHGQSAVWAVPQLGAGASSGRVWRIWAAWHSQGEARPLGSQPLPRLIELAAFHSRRFHRL